MNTIILKGYFKDAEYDAIFKYARFLPKSDEPYIFERSSKVLSIANNNIDNLGNLIFDNFRIPLMMFS